MNMAELQLRLQDYGMKRKRKEELALEVKKLNEELDVLNKELTDIMVKEKIQNMKIDGLGLFYVETNAYPSIENEQELMHWLEENELMVLAPHTISKSKLKTLVKERLEENLPTPPGVKVYTEQEVVMRKK